MNARATLANLAWFGASLPAHRRFVRALRDPMTAQESWLRAHLRRNATTAYGRAHGIGEIHSYAGFAQRVPVVDYDALAPWIARIKRGEPNVLTTEPVTRLLPTSGSTSARKLIPFTASLQREFNAAIGPWFVDLCRQHPAILGGPAYWSVTPLDAAIGAEDSAVPIGFDDDASYLGRTRAWLVDAAMAVPSRVRAIRDLREFRHVVLRRLLARRDLRFVSVWHPSFFLLLLDTLREDWDELRGNLPARGGDPFRLETLWPHLRVVSCWADALASGPAEALRRRLPSVTVQAKGLLATEAFVTLPWGDAHPLAVRSHFFEFIDEHGAIVPVSALHAGGIYEVIVTMSGGLWRYRLGDQVEVTGFVDRTPSLRFLGRAGVVSDLCGEKLAEPFVGAVLRDLFPNARFAMLTPEPGTAPPRYRLYLEADAAPDQSAALDRALAANPHYALARALGQLGAVSIVRVGAGAYARYVTAEIRRGRRLGDIKPVALSRRADWAAHFDERVANRLVQPSFEASLP